MHRRVRGGSFPRARSATTAKGATGLRSWVLEKRFQVDRGVISGARYDGEIPMKHRLELGYAHEHKAIGHGISVHLLSRETPEQEPSPNLRIRTERFSLIRPSCAASTP